MDKQTRKYLSEIGKKGGQKSRRVLTKEQAQAMVRAREAKKKKDVVNDSNNDVESMTNNEPNTHKTNNQTTPSL